MPHPKWVKTNIQSYKNAVQVDGYVIWFNIKRLSQAVSNIMISNKKLRALENHSVKAIVRQRRSGNLQPSITSLKIGVVALFTSWAINSAQPINSMNAAKTSTVDYVQIKKGLEAEALFYYRNNWLQLRKIAKAKGYIDSFAMIETKRSNALPFDLMLITTYTDNEQFDLREKHFRDVMQSLDGLKLLKDKKPEEFRTNWQAQEPLKTQN